ncbi:hypothetical protein MHYP_G00131230 [Metynnis hypsauchen]
MSPTGAHGSPLLIDEDQVQNVTIAVKEMLSLFTAVTVEDGEHALKKLHRSIIDAVYTDLVRRMTSEYRLIEAVKTNSEQLPGSLARSIIIALKNADHKGCESEEVKSNSTKRKGIFFHLKMPKLFKKKVTAVLISMSKKSRKDNGGHADQDPLQSRRNADMGKFTLSIKSYIV